MGIVLIGVIIWLLVRKGYKADESVQSLTSVNANAA